MLFESIFSGLHHALHVCRQNARRLNDGQGLVEYALILVLVAVVVIVILSVMGPSLGNIFSNIVCGVLDAQNAACFN
jgi:pilus assembly protein Flp/PilA